MRKTYLHCAQCVRAYVLKRLADGLELSCAACGNRLQEGAGPGFRRAGEGPPSDGPCSARRSIFAALFPSRRREKDPFLGKTISGAKLTKRLAVHPTRIIYRAAHRELRTDVRVEVFPPDFVDANMDYVRELFRRAALTNEVRSVHVATVLDMGRRRDCCFIIRQFEPSSLRDLLAQKGQLSVRRTLVLAEDVLRGLGAIEDAGAIQDAGGAHGNVTPDGILIGYDGAAKLDHLGNVLRADDLSRLFVSQGGTVAGPAFYLGPEAAGSPPVPDLRLDLYAFGATVYEALAGRPPYEGASAQEVMRKHASERVPQLRDARPHVPEELSQFVARLMAKDPSARPQTARAALDELRECAVMLSRRGSIGPVRAAVTPDERKRSGLKWAAAWSAVAAVFVMAAVMPVVMMYRGCQRRRAQPAAEDPRAQRRVAVLMGEGDRLVKDQLSAEQSLAVRTLIAQALSACPPLAAADVSESAELERAGQATEESLANAGLKHVLVATHAAGLGRRNWTLRFVTPGPKPWSVSAECAVEDGRANGLEPLENAMKELLAQAAARMGAPFAPLPATGADEKAWAAFGDALRAERDDRWADALSHARRAADAAPGAATFEAFCAFCAGVDQLRRTGRIGPGAAFAPDRLPPEAAWLAGVLDEMSRGDRTQVEQRFAEHLTQFPRSARGYFLLGAWRLHGMGQREEAAFALKHAAEIDPGYLPAAHAYAEFAAGQTAPGADQRR